MSPNKFFSLDQFQVRYADLSEEGRTRELHNMLKPHLLRRLRKDVEKSLPANPEKVLKVPMSKMQKQYYKWILTKNFSELNKSSQRGKASTLLNIVVELKKNCNHPYLFEAAQNLTLTDEDKLAQLISNSGKLVVLDKLLGRLKESGHKVLIFTQMLRMLDILSDYLKLKGFVFQRLDGSTKKREREMAMDSFNSPTSKDFCFILSSRAGGLGFNLSAADTVIIFDSDWNPQNDLQAEDKAYCMGQKVAVNIYRLITKNTVEEDILERSRKKTGYDHLGIQKLSGDHYQSGRTKPGPKPKGSAFIPEPIPKEGFSKSELSDILKFGSDSLFKEDSDGFCQEDWDIDVILSRAEASMKQEAIKREDSNQKQLNSAISNRENSGSYEAQFWNPSQSDSKESPLKRNLTDMDENNLNDGGWGEAAKKQQLEMDERDETEEENIESYEQDDGRPIDSTSPELATKEIIRIVNVIKIWASLFFLGDMVQACHLVSRDRETIATTIKGIIDSAKENVALKQHAKTVYFNYKNVNVNATLLVQRLNRMESLRNSVASFDNPLLFKLPCQMPVWTPFQKFWGPTDDSMIALGVVWYGMGNWEKIRMDSRLNLTYKLNTLHTQSTNPLLPNTTQLIDRMQLILKTLSDVSTGTRQNSRVDAYSA
jgi:chromodomain-helicase-DNA-binding protein 1